MSKWAQPTLKFMNTHFSISQILLANNIYNWPFTILCSTNNNPTWPSDPKWPPFVIISLLKGPLSITLKWKSTFISAKYDIQITSKALFNTLLKKNNPIWSSDSRWSNFPNILILSFRIFKYHFRIKIQFNVSQIWLASNTSDFLIHLHITINPKWPPD